MTKIIPPTNCPSCNSTLTWVKDQLYCKNDTCANKVVKSLEHWAKTLRIKGLGPRSIEKLNLKNIHDLYALKKDDIKNYLKSEKLAEKLVVEIERSKESNLEEILPAFGIPLIGKTATEKLKKSISNIKEINYNKCKEAGLGPKASENLIKWYNDNFIGDLENLPLNFNFSKLSNKNVKSKGTICITGKLKSFSTKKEAEEKLKDLGYEVKSSLTKDVNILVNESGIESAKTSKARESGVTIVDNLNTLIN